MNVTEARTTGKQLTLERKRARRAVVAGRARWLSERPKVIEVRQPDRPPTRHTRQPFGAGLGERHPTYRAPFSFEDEAWWLEQARREEDLLLDRLGREYDAQMRLEAGYEPW
jgi:hypothetical protein